MLEKEIWKPIPGFTGYDVSNLGRVRSYRARAKGGTKRGGWYISDEPQTILKQSIRDDRYKFVCLLNDKSERRVRLVHQLVMLAFVGPCPDNLEICHNNGNGKDNRLDNLRYDTHQSNVIDSVIHGSKSLSIDDVVEIRERRASGESGLSIAGDMNITESSVYQAGRGYTHSYIDTPPVIGFTVKRKLSDRDIAKIKKFLTEGMKQRTIAAIFGVTESMISRIKHGSRRADVAAG